MKTVAALIDRHRQQVMRTVQDELAEAVNLPVEQAVGKLVAVAVKQPQPRLYV